MRENQLKTAFVAATEGHRLLWAVKQEVGMAKLAELLEVSRQALYQRFQSGKPPREDLRKKITSKLGIPESAFYQPPKLPPRLPEEVF